MPTYEYRCKDCGHELEAQQPFTDDPLTECPSCGGALKKRFGSVGISFKGSGFYKNDARGTSSSTPPSTSDAGKAESDSTTKSADTTTKAAPASESASSSASSSSSTPSSSGSESSGSSSGTSAA